jgi:hypothetical protein
VNLGPSHRRTRIVEMLAFPAIEFRSLGCSKWERPGICRDAVPDFLDQAEPLFDTKVEDLFNADAHER